LTIGLEEFDVRRREALGTARACDARRAGLERREGNVKRRRITAPANDVSARGRGSTRPGVNRSNHNGVVRHRDALKAEALLQLAR